MADQTEAKAKAKANANDPKPEKKGYFKGLTLKKKGSLKGVKLRVQDNYSMNVLVEAMLPLELPKSWVVNNGRHQLRVGDEIVVPSFVADNLRQLKTQSMDPERLGEEIDAFVPIRN